jgi:hypothetical protein
MKINIYNNRNTVDYYIYRKLLFKEGPLPVTDSIFVSPLAQMYSKMARNFGFLLQDVNGENQTAFDIPQV